MLSVKALDTGSKEHLIRKVIQILLPILLGGLAYLVSINLEVVS